MQEESQTIVTRGVKNDGSMNIALAKPEVWLTYGTLLPGQCTVSVTACLVQEYVLRRWEEWMGAVKRAVQRSYGRDYNVRGIFLLLFQLGRMQISK